MLMILWMIAGYIIGHIAMDIVPLIKRITAPMIYRFAMGLVGALTAYTIFTKCI